MTYTFMGLSKETGELGFVVTTCSVACGARLSTLTRTGALVISQAFARPELAFDALDLLEAGKSFLAMNEALAAKDSFYSYRQLGILTRDGKSFVHTGADCDDWKGQIIGKDYISMGNLLVGPRLLEAMARAFEDSKGETLAERLLRAIEAGQKAGGQDWHGEWLPELSAQVCVYGASRMPELDLRVDFATNAVDALRRLYRAYRKVEKGYVLGAENPPKCLEYLAGTFEELDLYNAQV
jgi:uncharacterized Ntn-hydrolase superfamily protein